MRIIKGHWRDEGNLLNRGTLLVEQTPAGWREYNYGFPLRAATYKICDGMTGVEITSPLCCWEFLPDSGECERIGMQIKE